jgi:hypothetical protein
MKSDSAVRLTTVCPNAEPAKRERWPGVGACAATLHFSDIPLRGT